MDCNINEKCLLWCRKVARSALWCFRVDSFVIYLYRLHSIEVKHNLHHKSLVPQIWKRSVLVGWRCKNVLRIFRWCRPSVMACNKVLEHMYVTSGPGKGGFEFKLFLPFKFENRYGCHAALLALQPPDRFLPPDYASHRLTRLNPTNFAL